MAKELLTDVTVRNTKPTDKNQRLNDGGGLHLLIKPNGAKWWRFDYTFNTKRKTLSVGVYPETTLADARRKAKETRNQLSNGIDPSETRKQVKKEQRQNIENEKRIDAGLPVIDSFEFIAREWYTKNITSKSESYQKRVLNIFERDLFPWLGKQPISGIKAPELLEVLQRIETRSIETSHRALRLSGVVFRYAVGLGTTDYDITANLRTNEHLAKVNKGHLAAITEPQQVARLLRAIDNYSGSFVVKSALQLAPLVFVRPSELYRAEWDHIDLEIKEWRYLVTKTNTQHIVPLCSQALAILETIKQLTGGGRYVFPSARTPNGSRPLSNMALLAALRNMGFTKDEMTVHGFRAMARTIMDEGLKMRVDLIEHQLAHAVRDANGRAYNRTAHLDDRHIMMQSWADYLDNLKAGAAVIAFKKIG
jgi:integrase